MKILFVSFLVLTCIHNIYSVSFTEGSASDESSEETWTGKWFPERTTEGSALMHDMEGESESHNMGVEDFCDDGETNLDVDFSGESSAYICMHPRNRIVPDDSLRPLLELEAIPQAYTAEHKCMNETIQYSHTVPTFGTHRQLWPVFGEYKFVPTQRWLHTLEHGGIVALYHPCADLRGIRLLKNTVKSCLRRHVISPLETIDKNLPFVVVAWGVRLRMPWVSANSVRDFIQNHALKGPEMTSREGQFKQLLIEKAAVVSDLDDSQLCPSPLAHD